MLFMHHAWRRGSHSSVKTLQLSASESTHENGTPGSSYSVSFSQMIKLPLETSVDPTRMAIPLLFNTSGHDALTWGKARHQSCTTEGWCQTAEGNKDTIASANLSGPLLLHRSNTCVQAFFNLWLFDPAALFGDKTTAQWSTRSWNQQY